MLETCTLDSNAHGNSGMRSGHQSALHPNNRCTWTEFQWSSSSINGFLRVIWLPPYHNQLMPACGWPDFIKWKMRPQLKRKHVLGTATFTKGRLSSISSKNAMFSLLFQQTSQLSLLPSTFTDASGTFSFKSTSQTSLWLY